MDRKCDKCKQVISDDDFLCPYCGAILGDDMVIPAAVPQKKHAGKHPIRKSLRLVYVAVLLALAILTVGFLWEGFTNEQTPSIAPSEAETTQTTAPLTVYNIQIKTDGRNTFDGVNIHIIKDGQELYTCVSGQYGKASIILPVYDGYSIRLTGLPTEYQLVYNEVAFPFPDGQRELIVVLEKKPVPYTVKVVNEAGEPLPGTDIAFIAFGEAERKVTDENGCCVFESRYAEEGIHAEIGFAPTGYYVRSKIISFNGATTAEVVLTKFEDLKLHDSHCLYSVQVIDEYGDPVSDLSLHVMNDDAWWEDLDYDSLGYYLQTRGQTNLDGWYTFIGNKDDTYSIIFPQHPDYSHIQFQFEEGSTHQQIQLEMHKTEFTYTVTFVNQFNEPIPGVEISVSNCTDFEPPMSYTSDENGIISFQSKESDPSCLLFWITSVPDGYNLDTMMYERYYFGAYSRTRSVKLEYRGEKDITITVVDDYGAPIAGAALTVTNQYSGETMEGKTDVNGQCVLPLSTIWYYRVDVVSLPKGYEHLTFPPMMFEGFEIEITIQPITQPIALE